MLLRQDGGRNQIHHLLFILNRFEGGAQGDLCLSIAHVTADQTIHDLPAFHITLGGIDGIQLVLRLLIGKHLFKLLLPYGIRSVLKALRILSGRVKLY